VPSRGNGEVEVKVPVLGEFRIAGRDLMLAIVILALGAGAIGVQYISIKEFQRTLTTEHNRIIEIQGNAHDERRYMLGLLRVLVCTSETLQRTTTLSDAARERIHTGWSEFCLDAPAVPPAPVRPDDPSRDRRPPARR
jgi:hypothetical protein